MTEIERVARVIEEAQSMRAFGLYDYSKWRGESAPHVVRDERTGDVLLQTWDADEAKTLYEKLKREHVARAAIAAMQADRPVAEGWVMVPAKATVEMVAAFWRQKNTGCQEPGEYGDARSDFDAWHAAIAAAPAHPVDTYAAGWRDMPPAATDEMKARVASWLEPHEAEEVYAAFLSALPLPDRGESE